MDVTARGSVQIENVLVETMEKCALQIVAVIRKSA